MFLLDTNVWLERLLDQEKSGQVVEFLQHIPSERLCITDFSLHSIGVILIRLDKAATLERFVDDLFFYGAVALIRLEPEDLKGLARIIERYRLDFDDAYQYAAAEKHRLTIVSFDSDFDRTELGRKTPPELLGA